MSLGEGRDNSKICSGLKQNPTWAAICTWCRAKKKKSPHPPQGSSWVLWNPPCTTDVTIQKGPFSWRAEVAAHLQKVNLSYVCLTWQQISLIWNPCSGWEEPRHLWSPVGSCSSANSNLASHPAAERLWWWSKGRRRKKSGEKAVLGQHRHICKQKRQSKTCLFSRRCWLVPLTTHMSCL